MQSEERHELKQNDLQEFLGNFGEFWKKSGNATMITITLVVVVLAGYRLYSTHTSTQHENAWTDLALSSSPAAFAELGLNSPFPATRAKANLNAADLYLQESLADTPESETSLGGLTAAQKLDEAARLYQLVLDEEKAHEAFKVNAALGLAVVAEGKGNFTDAAAQFKAVIERASDTYPAHAAAAQAHLDMITRLENPVALAADPPAPIDLVPPVGPGETGGPPSAVTPPEGDVETQDETDTPATGDNADTATAE